MVRPDKDDVQTDRDIRRAHALISRLRGLTLDDSVAALHDHAVLRGVSIHTAALAVLAEWQPAGGPRRKVPTASVYTTTDGTGRIVVRWQGREKAHLGVSGACTDDLAARLRRAVERLLRADATELIVDTRGTTGADDLLVEVLAWTGRRLWARRGVLVVRASTPDGAAAGPA